MLQSNTIPPTAVTFLRARHQEPNGPDREIEQQMITWQRAACEQTATALGAQIIREYAEYGGTGGIDKHLTVRLMLNELHARHDVTYLIATRPDRLARQPHDWATIQQKLNTAGTTLVFAATHTHHAPMSQ